MSQRTLEPREAGSRNALGDRPSTRPPARKARRFWFDPRFAIGLALVVIAVVGTVFVVAAADTTTPVLGARSDLAVGELVTADDFVPVAASLAGAADLYLEPGQVPADGLVVTRPITAGELVAISALGSAAGVDSTTIVIPLDAAMPAAVRTGAGVDVWAAREIENGRFGPPAVIVAGASVVRLVEATGLVVADDSGAVEILVPRARVARVLEAIANGDSISLVPVSVPLEG